MNILSRCLQLGASAAEEIEVDKLTLQPELRDFCTQNVCGRYNRNYACPPHVGEIGDLIARIRSFSKAVIWQNIYPLEDSFDFEGMMDAQRRHNAMTLEIAREVYAAIGRDHALVLAAGGCSACKVCAAQTGEPCRTPEDALSSLEAHGILVSKLEDVSSMKYINGENTVTYFSGAFLP